MTRIRTTLTVLAAAALLVPVAASADPGKSRSGKAKKEHRSDKAKKEHVAKAKNAQFKGTVVSVDAATGTVTVTVLKASKHGRAFKGQDVAFTTAGVKKIKVADTNADGKRDLLDVKPGDRAHVGARIAKDAAAPLAARKFHAKAPGAEEQEDAPAPAPTPAP